MARLLTAADVAARLGVSRTLAYDLIKRMIHVRLGDRALRVSELALETFIRNRTVDPWVTGSTGGGRSGTAGTTARTADNDGSLPGAPTGGPPSPSSVSGKGRRTI